MSMLARFSRAGLLSLNQNTRFGVATIMRTFSEGSAASNVKAATVKWFDVTKGFGFCAPSDGSADIFVHQSVIHSNGFRSLADGEAVEVTVVTESDGRVKASKCTGPAGAFVQGAPRPSFGGGQSRQGGGGFRSGDRDGNRGGSRGPRRDQGDF